MVPKDIIKLADFGRLCQKGFSSCRKCRKACDVWILLILKIDNENELTALNCQIAKNVKNVTYTQSKYILYTVSIYIYIYIYFSDEIFFRFILRMQRYCLFSYYL